MRAAGRTAAALLVAAAVLVGAATEAGAVESSDRCVSRVVAGTARGGWDPFVSGDGSTAAYVRGNDPQGHGTEPYARSVTGVTPEVTLHMDVLDGPPHHTWSLGPLSADGSVGSATATFGDATPSSWVSLAEGDAVWYAAGPTQTAPGGGMQDPDLSADGARVVFVGRENTVSQHPENPEIWIDDRDGPPTQITDTPEGVVHGEPAISADGSRVAFIADGDALLWDEDSAGLQELTTTGDVVRLDLSADGTAVAFRAGNTIGLWTEADGLVDTGLDQIRTTDGGFQNEDADLTVAISGNGRRIVFVSNRALTGEHDQYAEDVYAWDRVDGELSRLSLGPGMAGRQHAQRPTISDDGRTATFAVSFAGTRPPGQSRTIVAASRCTAFTDVGISNRFFTEIHSLHDQGLSNGYPDGSFRPNAPITRRATATILSRLAGPPVPPPLRWADATTRQTLVLWLHRLAGEPVAPEVAEFTDRPGGDIGAAIDWAAAEGIVTGFPDQTFRPAAPVTRAALAAIVVRYQTWDATQN